MMDPLSQAEKNRASRFRFEKEQARFISGRAALRVLLGRYTGVAPEKVALRYEPQGKPVLADSAEWQLTLPAHFRELAVLALSRGAPVGIDLEWMDPDFPRNEVAPDIFSEEELGHLRGLPAAEQPGFFFQAWTAKEALLKAVGKGFSIEPKSIAIRIGAGLEPEIVSAPADFEGMHLQGLAIQANFAASLAVGGKVGRVEVFDFEMRY